MQQPKRRSKRGVILLAVVAALLVMAVVPAVALAADTVSVNDGQAYATDFTFKVTYSSTTADRVTFEVQGPPQHHGFVVQLVHDPLHLHVLLVHRTPRRATSSSSAGVASGLLG